MKQSRSTRNSWRQLATSFLATALCWTAGLRAAAAAPIKVACIGEHTTHSHAFPANNRETQPVGMQEYPAQLQTMIGQSYDVRNFGDCCSTVLQGYTVAETHPYVNGTNAGDGVGFNQSLTFLPDIVVVGSWGRHDWGKSKAPGQVFTIQGFQDGYDDLVKRYQALASHPKIFVSLPIPILNGQGDVADNGIKTSDVLPAVKAIAAKYNLPIIDLYTPFLNHMELFKPANDPGGEGEGEHVTNAGLTIIANTVAAAIKADLLNDGGTGDASAAVDASLGAGGTSGASDAALGSAGSGGSGGSGATGTAGQETAGTQGGSSDVPAAGGSNAAGAAPAAAAADSGCSCSFASQTSPASRASWLALGGLAILVRRRQRAKIRS